LCQKMVLFCWAFDTYRFKWLLSKFFDFGFVGLFFLTVGHSLLTCSLVLLARCCRCWGCTATLTKIISACRIKRILVRTFSNYSESGFWSTITIKFFANLYHPIV
jgi:hypothetical protein